MNRRSLLSGVGAAMMRAALLLPAGIHDARAADKVAVVASFSILGDMVRQVGGDRVAVTMLVGPSGDAHVYQPTPADAQAVSRAKVLVVNGLGFEGWISRLERSSGFGGTLVTASKGVRPQQMEQNEGGKPEKVTDPHAWQSLANGKLYVRNIRDGLIKADPDGRASYEANAARLIAAMDVLESEVRAAFGKIPPDRRKIITSHDAFGYFGMAYGMQFIAPQGVSTETEPSAKDVARIIRQIKSEKIPAVFLENIADPRLLEQISRETGAKIGGTLYADALSPPDGPAASYLDMFHHNVATLSAALSS